MDNDNNTTDNGVKDVSEQIEEAARLDAIYETLCSVDNGTRLAQDYLTMKADADNAVETANVLGSVNTDLRKDNAKLKTEVRETRRLLDGREPTIVEVERAPVVKHSSKKEVVIKTPTMSDIKSFFEE